MKTLTIKLRIRDPLEIIVILSYLGMILPHYAIIGHLLPKMRSDIATHLTLSEVLIKSPTTYEAYPYIGFHIILTPISMITDSALKYQVAGLLVFSNIFVGLALFIFLKKLFASSIPALFGALMTASGNIVWLSMITFIFQTDDYIMMNVLAPLSFTSRYNLSSYLLLQFSPLSIIITLICFSLMDVGGNVSSHDYKAFRLVRSIITYLSIYIMYLIHPLYSLLFHVLLLFSILVRAGIFTMNTSQRYPHNVILHLIIGGFIPAFISYFAINTSYTYRFQTTMFSMLNASISLLILLIAKKLNLIMQLLEKLNKYIGMSLKYVLSLFMVGVWVFSLCELESHVTEGFNAWMIVDDPTPLWLYPVLVGIGPIIMTTIAMICKDSETTSLSLLCLLFVSLFVLSVPLVDFINFNILGMHKIDGYVLYSGVTSGRILALANLLSNMFSGATVGFAIERNVGYRMSSVIGILALVLLLVPFLVSSLTYWNLVRNLVVK